MNRNLNRWFLLVYGTICTLVLISSYLGLETTFLLSKPMLAASLLIFFGALTGSQKGNVKRSLILGGLFFCVAGDFMMMFVSDYEAFMKIGALLYLIVIIMYTVVFAIDVLRIKPLVHKWYQLAMAVLILVLGVEFHIINSEKFGMFLPVVLIFNIGLTLMAMMAAFRSINQNKHNYIAVLVGSLFFNLSYALMAIDHFVVQFPMSDLLVLIGYMIALYLIVSGSMKEFLKQDVSYESA